jgi:hypothetical protein
MDHLDAESPETEGVPLALSTLRQIEEVNLGDNEPLRHVPQVRKSDPRT